MNTAFKSFDLDNNSFVGAAELRQVYLALGENATDEEVSVGDWIGFGSE